jgi:protein phosphatase
MRILGLLTAVALLAWGLFRVFFTHRRLPAGPQRSPRKLDAPPAAARPEPARAPGDAVSSGKPAPANAAERPRATEAQPQPAPEKPAAGSEERKPVPSMLQQEDADEDITIITLAPSPIAMAAMNAVAARAALATPVPVAAAPAPRPAADAPPPNISTPEPVDDDDDDPGELPSAIPIIYDEDASVDEPTRVNALILVSAASQTDQGRKRRRNEDSLLVLDDHHLYVVADGMGGHAGGDVASKMAAEAIGDAFKKNVFEGDPYPDVPRRGGELALAIQMANKAIYDHARANAAYQGMGTTVVSARFSPNKQRLYVGHVGDSRCYRLRNKQLTQITTDHTMGAQGVTGPLAAHLNRAVGVGPGVKVDLIIVRPRPEDVYLLCSDGLSKMVADADIQQILLDEPDLGKAVQKLVERANARGGRDNITVILVQVKDPKGFARYVQQITGAAGPS